MVSRASIASRASARIAPQFGKTSLSVAVSLSNSGKARGSPNCPKANTDQKRTSTELSLRAFIKGRTARSSLMLDSASAACPLTCARSLRSSKTRIKGSTARLSPNIPRAWAARARTSRLSSSLKDFKIKGKAWEFPRVPNARIAALRKHGSFAPRVLRRAGTAVSSPHLASVQQMISSIFVLAFCSLRIASQPAYESAPVANTKSISARTRRRHSGAIASTNACSFVLKSRLKSGKISERSLPTPLPSTPPRGAIQAS